MTADIRSFLQEIKKTNDLIKVKKKVSTKYEIAALTAKLDESKAVLFENIKGSKFKLVSNLVNKSTTKFCCKAKIVLFQDLFLAYLQPQLRPYFPSTLFF